MKQVSKQYKNSMKGVMRNKSHCSIEFLNININTYKYKTITPFPNQDTTNIDNIDYTTDNVANLCLNSWDFNNLKEPSTDSNLPYMSNNTNKNGNIENNTVLRVNFSVPQTLPGLTIIFTHHVPSSLYLYINGTENKMTRFKNTYVYNKQLDNIVNFEIRLGDNNLPLFKFQIDKLVYGNLFIFTNEDLIDTTEIRDVDPLCRRLPEESLEVKIHDIKRYFDPENINSYYDRIYNTSPIRIRYGYEVEDNNIEWLKYTKYVLDGKPEYSKNTATFKAVSYLSINNNVFNKQQYGSINLYDLALLVLNDMNLNYYLDGNKWYLDNTLKNFNTNTIINGKTHLECLQLIAHASNCILYSSDDGIINIKPFYISQVINYKGTWDSTSGDINYSTLDYIENDNIKNYNTLDLNHIDLNNTDKYTLIPSIDNLNFVSSSKSNSSGDMEDIPIITRTFENPCDLRLVTIDSISLPIEASLTCYDDTSNIITKVKSEIVDNKLVFNFTALNVKKFSISILKTLFNSRAYVDHIDFKNTDIIIYKKDTLKDGLVLNKHDFLAIENIPYYIEKIESESEIYNVSNYTEQTLSLTLDDNYIDISINCVGGNIINREIGTNIIKLELSTGNKTIIIKGKKLTYTKIDNARVYNRNGLNDCNENILINNMNHSNIVINRFGEYLNLRSTYTLQYRGNPEIEPLDIISLESNYGNMVDAIVLKSTIKFNGSLTGEMIVKGVITNDNN